jgi:hypothetical protein
LTSLLGAPLAAVACRNPVPPPVAGSIRGAALDVGHLLRSAPMGGASAEGERIEVAIIGAGPSGLSAAWRLERLGFRDFVLFDLEDRAGGTSRYGDDGLVPYPWGAHYVPVPAHRNAALSALLEEIGAIRGHGADGRPVYAEEQIVRAPEERLFYKGRWYEGLYPRAGASHDELAELERFHRAIDDWVEFRDDLGRRAFTLPIAAASTDPRLTSLDRISMATWLDQQGLTGARLRWFVDYACRDDYGLSVADASAWAGIFYFASRVEKAGAEAADLLSWSSGNGRLVEHLTRVAGHRVRTGRLVTDVAPDEDGVDVTVFDVARRTLVRHRAAYAIFALPKFMARFVVRPWREHAPEHLARFDYGPWMVANLHLRSRPRTRGVPFAWDNVLYDSPSLGYVVATHQRELDYGPTIWTYYYPFVDADARAGRRRLLDPDHAAWCDVILADLGRAHTGLREAIERIDVFRWGHAMARPRVGSMFDGARERAAVPFGRIHFAHSDLSGVGLFEEAQYHGVRAAEAVLRRRGFDVPSLG